MTSAQTPICRIIAGPNGAGAFSCSQGTFALTYLRQFPEAQSFVNADLIAAGLSPLAPQQQLLAASRLMLHEIDAHVRARRSFAFETTLSGRGYLQLIRRLRRSGWRLELVYLALPSVELSILRVAERVAHVEATMCPCLRCSGAFRVVFASCWRPMRQPWIMRCAI